MLRGRERRIDTNQKQSDCYRNSNSDLSSIQLYGAIQYDSGEHAPFFGMESYGSLANQTVEQIEEVVRFLVQWLLAKINQIFMLAHFKTPLFISICEFVQS